MQGSRFFGFATTHDKGVLFSSYFWCLSYLLFELSHRVGNRFKAHPSLPPPEGTWNIKKILVSIRRGEGLRGRKAIYEKAPFLKRNWKRTKNKRFGFQIRYYTFPQMNHWTTRVQFPCLWTDLNFFLLGNSMGIPNPILYFYSNDSLYHKSPISCLCVASST